MSSKGTYKGLTLFAIIAFILISIIISFADTADYIYDNLNRLERIELEDGTVIQYIYDEVGNRERRIITGLPDISAAPSPLYFGNVMIGIYSEMSVIVTNTGRVNLEIGSVTSPLSPFSIINETCSGQTIAYLDNCVITVRFEPTDSIPYLDSFEINSNDPDENPVTVDLTGRGGTEVTPPTGSVIIDNDAAYATSTSVTLTLTASDSSGVSEMCISNTSSCFSWIPYTASTPWTLTSGDETKTVYVWYRDSQWNESVAPETDDIILDTTGPDDGSLTAIAGDEESRLNWSGFTDDLSAISSYRIVYSESSYPDAYCTNGSEIYSGSDNTIMHSNLTDGITYYYRICAFDTLGNISVGTTASAAINLLAYDDDGDGISDYEESVFGSDYLDSDTDNDGVDDLNDSFPLDPDHFMESDMMTVQITDAAFDQRYPKISGNYIVWTDYREVDSGIYAYDLSTHTEIQIKTMPPGEFVSDISGDRIIWSEPIDIESRKIYLYNFITAEPEIQINTNENIAGTVPVISGNRVVWATTISGDFQYDIYLYDILQGGAEINLTDNSFSQGNVNMSANDIVWRDTRHGDWEIYSYDVSTEGPEMRITTDPADQMNPYISGNYLIWQEKIDEAAELFLYDISTAGPAIRVASYNDASYTSPKISGNTIGWIGGYFNWNAEIYNELDVYMFDIETGTETRITYDYNRKGRLEVFGKRIVWGEERNGIWNIYMYGGDGIPDDIDKCPTIYDPDQIDSDTDGIGDECDPCPSDDTAGCDMDNDNDGIMDSCEIQWRLDRNDPDDADDDPDEDGLTNSQECQYGTDLFSSDTDNDGMDDEWEVTNNLDPLNDDASGDNDSDGLTNFCEYRSNSNPNSPLDGDADNDGDSLTNLQECELGTDLNDHDTDNDQIDDSWEVDNDLNPLDAADASEDTDNDGFFNIEEYEHGTDCRDENSTPDNGVLMQDDFEDIQSIDRWKVFDDGTEYSPSSWSISRGMMVQESNIYGGSLSGTDPEKTGTYIYKGDANWHNYELTFVMKSEDDDAIGVMFRYIDNDNYYRFSMDKERSYRRLIRKTGEGGIVTLAEDSFAYNEGVLYKLKIMLLGNNISIYMDEYDGNMLFDADDLVFNVTDSPENSVNKGKIAFYSWANPEAEFDDITVSKIWDIQSPEAVNSYTGTNSSIAIDTSGNPHISYYDYSNGDLKYAKWTGPSWDIQTVDEDVSSSRNISITLDNADNPHIRYFKSGSGDLMYATLTGVTWDIQPVSEGGNVGQYLSLALDESGTPHISSYDVIKKNLQYVTLIDSSWEIDPVDEDGVVGKYTSIGLDINSNPHISYYDFSNGDLKYAKKTGSSWDVKIVDRTGYVGEYNSIMLDTNGIPHISYYDYSNGDLKYAKSTGTSWNIQTVDSKGDVGKYNSLALDTNGNPHISYYDLSNRDLKYAKWTGKSWNVQTVHGLGYVGEHSSIAIDSLNVPHISYYDYVNRQLKYAVSLCLDNTDPYCGRDSDGDGMPDSYEFQYGLDSGSDDSAGHLDGDGLTNLQEYQQGTNPTVDDTDGDGYDDDPATDNCPDISNPQQHDVDTDGIGDMCDNCRSDSNYDQADSDKDDIGNACDNCPLDADNDIDGDTRCGNNDNCPFNPNLDQTDTDGDGIGDECDNCQLDPFNDTDGDGICESIDNCPTDINPVQIDTDNDGRGDACDADDDDDGITDYEETVFNTEPLQWDTDGDGVDDLNDVFPMDDTETSDSDGKEFRITSDSSNQERPDISGNYILWYEAGSGNELYWYDISTEGPEMPIDSDLFGASYYGISGNRVIWHDVRNWDYNIYMNDIISGDREPIMYDVGAIATPAISGDRVIGLIPSNESWDIVVYDIPSDIESPTHILFNYNIEATISGDVIVWSRYGLHTFDLRTQTTSSIVSDDTYSPDISGDIIVWQDHRDGVNIYMYSISNEEETQITTGGTAYKPAVSGDRIVWYENRNGSTDIYMYNISTKQETQITRSGTAFFPDIFKNRIVWADNRSGDYDVYLYNGDGIGDNIDKCPYVYDPDQIDTDTDGIGDECDACPTVNDDDIPCDIDSDSDGMEDSFELYYGLDINIDDTTADLDNDGLTNIQEYNLKTNPIKNDTDKDGIIDSVDSCPLNTPAMIINDRNYSTIQTAYDNATDGSILQSQETTIIGDLNINREISVTIQGGYNCDYTAVTGKTSIKGMLTISDGLMNGENIILEK